MLADCVNTSSTVTLVHTAQKWRLLSGLYGRCASMYEMSTDSNSLKLVKGKPERLPDQDRDVCLTSLNRKAGGVGTWAKCYK